MVESGRPYEEIAVPDQLPCRTQSAAFTTEEATDVLIDPHHNGCPKKIIKGTLIAAWILGIVKSLKDALRLGLIMPADERGGIFNADTCCPCTRAISAVPGAAP
jgi:hypothetical protein